MLRIVVAAIGLVFFPFAAGAAVTPFPKTFHAEEIKTNGTEI